MVFCRGSTCRQLGLRHRSSCDNCQHLNNCKSNAQNIHKARRHVTCLQPWKYEIFPETRSGKRVAKQAALDEIDRLGYTVDGDVGKITSKRFTLNGKRAGSDNNESSILDRRRKRTRITYFESTDSEDSDNGDTYETRKLNLSVERQKCLTTSHFYRVRFLCF